MKISDIVLNNATGSSMRMYIADQCQELGHVVQPLMLVIPGGGYGFLADREAEPVALRYLAAGYNACILYYTLKDRSSWPAPLEDYDHCMDIIRAHAGAWSVDITRIAVAGFSAGGHLAACAATIARHRPAAAVLVYPVIDQVLCDRCQPNMTYPLEQVNESTSPCFIIAARDDDIVPVCGVLDFAGALEKKGVGFEMHIVSYGGHGFSTATRAIRMRQLSRRLSNWVDESIEWLDEVMGEPTCTKY